MIRGVSRLVRALLLIPVIIVAASFVSEASPPPRTAKVIVRADSSLQRVIQNAGYKLSDKDIAGFLREFMDLNEGVRSISRIRKGTVLLLPLSKLEKKQAGKRSAVREPIHQSVRPAAPAEPAVTEQRERVSPPEFAAPGLPRKSVLANIRTVLDELYGGVTTESGGLKFFSVGERSEISFDTSDFPMMVMNGGGVLVVDATGLLPDEIKQIIRSVWPEYTFVSYHDGSDLRKVVENLLVSLGYSVQRDATLIAGGRSKIEYRADFVIVRKGSDLMDGDIMALSIVKPREAEVPSALLRWLGERDIRIIQLHEANERTGGPGAAEVADDRAVSDVRAFIETLAGQLGYAVRRDVPIELSDRREYHYTLHADLSIEAGRRIKVIEFAPMSEPEIGFAHGQGVDIISLNLLEDTGSAAGRLADLLGVIHTDDAARYSPYITPRRSRYRLYLPGLFLRTVRGSFLVTDTELAPDLLREIVDPSVKVITY